MVLTLNADPAIHFVDEDVSLVVGPGREQGRGVVEEGLVIGVVYLEVHRCIFGTVGDPVEVANPGVKIVVLAFGKFGGGKGEGGGAEEGEEERKGLEEHCGWFERWWNELTGAFEGYDGER